MAERTDLFGKNFAEAFVERDRREYGGVGIQRDRRQTRSFALEAVLHLRRKILRIRG